MCAVPRLYEKAYAAIQARVAKAPPLRRALFAWATKVGTQVVASRQTGTSLSLLLSTKRALADRLVFRALRGLKLAGGDDAGVASFVVNEQ